MDKKSDKEIDLADIKRCLGKTTLFEKLTKKNLQDLASLCQVIQLKQNDVLFEQGDISDGFYILVKGRLAAFLDQGVSKKAIGLIHNGETVGELGGFSKKPRALTVNAIVDSTLIWLRHNNINRFLKHFASPEIIMSIVDTVISRSQSLIKHLGSEKQNRHCVIIPATTNDIPNKFIQSLKKYLVREHRILIIAEEIMSGLEGEALLQKLKSLIKKADEENTTLLFIITRLDRLQIYLDYYEKSEGLDIFHRVDSIFAVADANSDKKISQELRTLFDEMFLPLVQHKDLVLWYEDDRQEPSQTSLWLDQTSFRMHHHISNRKGDFLRLYRFMLGQANGLVLGGGGVRGWSSLGVIKALTEHGIAIDAICGTSAGSFLSSAYAYTQSIERSLEMVNPLINMMGVFKFTQLSYPIISINNGYVFTTTLKSVFSPLKIEDLRLFNFSMASNLSSYQEEVQRTGGLWEAVRCSGSLPIIFPPLVRDGELLIDGGLLNNLPVDQMKSIIGSSHFIIAVNLSDFAASKKYEFPPVIGFWQSLKNRLGLSKNPYSYPPFVESILKSLMLGSSYRVLENAKKADLLIDFKLNDIPLTYYPPDRISELIERGYHETLPYLRDIQVEKETGIIKVQKKV